MAHNLYINQFGKASFVSARIKPWHSLGQIVEKAMTSEEALKEAGLDYTVKKAPAYMEITKEDGTYSFEEVPKHFATYRVDTNQPFGIVGSKYTIIQNVEAFEFFDAIVGKGEAIYETAGALGNGEIVFITAKLPGHIRVPGEEIEKYIMLKLSHDGKSSIIGGFTPVRIVCNNTLNFAMKNLSTQISIRHTDSAQYKLNEAHKLMEIANKLTEELGEIFTNLKKSSIVDKDVQQLFKSLILTREEREERSPISTQKINTINDMWKYYNIGVGQKEILGTKFGAYNAVSGYFQNAKASSNPEGLIKSNMFGHNADIVKQSLNLLTVW